VTAFEGIAAALALAALAVRLGGRHHRLLHLFQLEHYEPARLLLWCRRRSELFQPREPVAIGALYAAAIANAGAGTHWLAGALLLASTPIAVPGIQDWRRQAVKPLVFTGRARRLFAVALAPSLLLLATAVALAAAGMTTAGLAAVLALGLCSLLFAPWILLAANRALAPVQGAIDRRYVRRARSSLDRVGPLVVGITGSYGKTTTKFCIGSVLAEDRPTLVTPDSYNSYLGVTRAINEHLEDRHRAFVVEMGMFRRGDIAELCRLVNPSIGVITAIGPMHLERLGSIEQIAAAKAELLDALPPDGHFVTNADDPRCLELAARAHVPVTLFGIDSPAADVSARDIRLQDGRTIFQLRLPAAGRPAPGGPGPTGPGPTGSAPGPGAPGLEVSAALLGRHNVYNLLAAAAVGRVLGIGADRIVRGLSSVQAPAHRLQPIHNRPAGIVVIDDAYNSNPDGARAALEVLAAHPAQRRLLVTPGMVELGEMEDQLNRRFGEQAASSCDIAVLVGPARSRPVGEGLRAAGMDESAIHVVRDIAEATALLGRLTRAGDVVLFENDLPDTYQEDEAAGPTAPVNNLSPA
jgi:UDP-N-acetylmuramoyl-tripeptide--D-alanyl-D-alanine ligase